MFVMETREDFRRWVGSTEFNRFDGICSAVSELRHLKI
jgi:hypothetical protein